MDDGPRPEWSPDRPASGAAASDRDLDASLQDTEEHEIPQARVAKLRVYAGQALSDKAVEPVTICLDFDVLGALWARNKAAWSAVLECIEDDLRRHRSNEAT